MCLIVDANAASKFLAARGLVVDWLLGPKGNPRLCTGGRLTIELDRVGAVQRILAEPSRAGRLRKIPNGEIRKHERGLRSERIHRSNDVHVLGLAIASGARTLATFDAAPSDDFKNPRIIHHPRGKVYQHPERHAHLLCHTPKSCHVHAQAR